MNNNNFNQPEIVLKSERRPQRITEIPVEKINSDKEEESSFGTFNNKIIMDNIQVEQQQRPPIVKKFRAINRVGLSNINNNE